MIADIDLAPRARTGWIVFGVSLAGLSILLAALGVNPLRAWANLLLASVYFLDLALGALVFLALMYLARAGWFVTLRRVPEAMASFLSVAALGMLLVFLGREHLYPWSRPEGLAEPAVAIKAAYLNGPFFLLRMVVFLGLWTFFAWRLNVSSRAQDEAPEAGLEGRLRLRRLSAVFMVVFAVTFSLASFDWLMSLEPQWYSTIYAVYQFAGALLGALAAITAGVVLLSDKGPLESLVREEHLHDLGKLLFAFSIFWAYIWLSQYLLIWYGNLPEEVTFYTVRTRAPWLGFFAGNVILNWVVPFTVLMSRRAKRTPRLLLAVAVVVLVGRWLDLYLAIMPAVAPGAPWPGLLEVAAMAGWGGLFVLALRRHLASNTLVPRYDPLLPESQAYRA